MIRKTTLEETAKKCGSLSVLACMKAWLKYPEQLWYAELLVDLSEGISLY